MDGVKVGDGVGPYVGSMGTICCPFVLGDGVHVIFSQHCSAGSGTSLQNDGTVEKALHLKQTTYSWLIFYYGIGTANNVDHLR